MRIFAYEAVARPASLFSAMTIGSDESIGRAFSRRNYCFAIRLPQVPLAAPKAQRANSHFGIWNVYE
jgi:hypothetical protein